jgi:D-alanyl-D-alanine carboxypeptidase/D-alanyl-D-alanine-endopeptidase (penicillin-binding protein 4)
MEPAAGAFRRRAGHGIVGIMCRAVVRLAVTIAAALLPLAAQDGPLAAAAKALQAAPCLRHARVGLQVVDLQDGRVLLAARADEGFVPASNQKLITALVALSTLGPDHRFRTALEMAGEVRDGELIGDLLFSGGGDPSLGSRFDASSAAAIDDLAKAVVDLGVRQLSGRVIGVADCQADEHRGTGWAVDDLLEDYAAPFGGLCYRDNVVSVHVSPTQPGVEPTVRIEPDFGMLTVQNQVLCDKPGSPTALRLQAGPMHSAGQTLVLRGTLGADSKAQELRVAVADPTLFAAMAMRAALQRRGIEVRGAALAAAATDRLPSMPKELGHHESPPLRQLLVPMLQDSINLWAEQLLRLAARRATDFSSTAGTALHTKAMLQKLGVDVDGMVVADGSGLSRLNLVQPRQLAAVLQAAFRSPHRSAFVDALPRAGVDGTLRTRFVTGAAHGRVRAKTGSLARVIALSGYCARAEPSAAPLLFVVLINDFDGDDAEVKAAVDAFVQALAEQVH